MFIYGLDTRRGDDNADLWTPNLPLPDEDASGFKSTRETILLAVQSESDASQRDVCRTQRLTAALRGCEW